MENVPFSEQHYSDREIYFSSLLIYEIENENIDQVKWLLLHKNADANLLLPNKGVSPMHVLAGLENECFSVEVIEIALEKCGGDPNIRSADGLTPVHLAAIWGRCEVLEILLRYGGDPTLLDYKCSLNAEDLALKEHQWQTHAILATFSVFNDKHDQLLDDNLHSSFWKPSHTDAGDLGQMTPAFTNKVYKECPPDCEDSISKSINSQDINSNMSLSKEEPRKSKDAYQTPQIKSTNSLEESFNFCGSKPFSGENVNEDKIRRKKKLSDQFTESFTKFKHFFGRASFPKLSPKKSSKVDSTKNASKISI